MFGRNKVAIELALLRSAVSELTAAVKDLKDDHEPRLRALERWRYSVPLSFATAVAALITQWAASHH